MKREIYPYRGPGCSDIIHIIQMIPYSRSNPIGWDSATFLSGTSQKSSTAANYSWLHHTKTAHSLVLGLYSWG